jgi:tRNA 2-selenouridine synthase
MSIERISIERFLELAKQHPILDVRSPGEYKHAHIPGAYSLPLFTDEERKVVGTAYKQKSREDAIKIGLDYFGPKMSKMIEEVIDLINRDRISGPSPQPLNPSTTHLLLYCWRGGMRSAGVAWLMDLYGFKVYTLAGGYKKFRNYVLDKFRLNYRINIVGGFTGSAKTELIKSLKEKGEQTIDLENIANHKGSAFGNIGMPPQPTQEMFENLLAVELRDHLPFTIDHSPLTTHPIWLEDESQRIGQVNIPGELWKTMRNSPVYFLDIPFEERLKHITEEYGQLDRQKTIDAILRISDKLGGLNAKNAIQLLEEGNTIESFRILLNYYDKLYNKSLHNRDKVNSLLQKIPCETISPENANLLINTSRTQFQKA